LAAREKAPTYAEADHSAPARPTANRTPAEPLLDCSSWIALVMIVRADPGAELAMLSINDCAVFAPASPMRETRTRSPGNNARMP
jgi:hypothetical protein